MSPLRTATLVGGAILLQVSLVAQFSIAGARADLTLLVVLAVAFVHGPDDGAVVGFAAGLCMDVFLSTPFGLTAFTFTIVGYAAGSWTAGIVRSGWWIVAPAIAAASIAAVLAQGVIGELLGQGALQGTSIVVIAAVVSSANLLLAPVATRLARWARVGERPHRRSLFA